MSKILRMVRQHPDVSYTSKRPVDKLLNLVVSLFVKVMPVFVITCLGAGFATVAIVRACVVYTDVS